MRRFPPFAFSLLLALAAATAARADAVTYQGTLGTLPIILELTSAVEEGGLPVGRYAYLSKGTDIPLQAVKGKAGLTLQEEKPCTVKLCGDPQNGDDIKAPAGATWTLAADGDSVTGRWADAVSGKTLPIALERVGSRSVDTSSGPSLDSLDPENAEIGDDGVSPRVLTAEMLPYDFQKMDVPLKPGKPQTLGGMTYRIDTDPRTQLGYPVILSLGGEDAAPVNAYLAQQRLQNGLASWRCRSAAYAGYGWNNTDGQGGNGYQEGGEPETITVEHLTPRLMGFSESGSFWCGGAHPDNFITRHLVDVRTGVPMNPESLLAGWQAIGRDDTPVDPQGYDNSDETLSFRPSGDLVAYVTANRQRFDAETEKDCGYDDLVAGNLGVYLTEDSLVLTLKDLPYVIFACTEDLVTVPLADARDLLTEKAAGYFEVLDR